LAWAGLRAQAGDVSDEIVFPVRRVVADTPLIHEGQAFDALYLVSSGSFKCVQTDCEGYEQVLEFAMHGDFLGLDGLGHHHHASGVVALEDASVVVIPMRQLQAVGREVPAMEALLMRAVGAEVQRRGDTQYMMAAPRSEVRVARFLLKLAQRQAALGYSDRRLRLRMTRRDIGSYLGVAHETVSRALTALSVEGCIKLTQRDIEFLDLQRLHELQRATRGRGLAPSKAVHDGMDLAPRAGGPVGPASVPCAAHTGRVHLVDAVG
jgi:CRP/FNR family transcriptional regulator